MMRYLPFLLLAGLTLALITGVEADEEPEPQLISGDGVLGLAGRIHQSQYTSDRALGVAMSGDYAYVAYGYSGLVVIDVSDPTNPTYVGGYDPHDCEYAQDVVVSGGYAFLACGYDGLLVVDVSDPANPTYTGSYNGADDVMDMAVVGGYAYVANGYNGFMVVVVGPDSDGDAFVDAIDAFPHDPEEWADSDGDGVGDNGDPMPNTEIITAWWQVGFILLIGFASGATSIYGYRQRTLAQRVASKTDELKAKIAKLKGKGIKIDELERVLAKSEE